MVEDESSSFIAQQGYLLGTKPPPASCSPFPSIPALAGATTTQTKLWSPERGGGHGDLSLVECREPLARRCLSPVTRSGKEFGDSNTWSMW